MSAPELPVRGLEQQLRAALRQHRRVVLTAPTGSGKTTQVPQMLLAGARGRIVVLQPRRLACRLVARRVAAELGSPLGQLAGFQTRYERQLAASRCNVFPRIETIRACPAFTRRV